MLDKLARLNPKAAQQLIKCLDDNIDAVAPADVGEGTFGTQNIGPWFTRALELEYTSWLSYFTYANTVRGLWRDNIAEMFFEHAEQELEHSKKLLLWTARLNIGSPMISIKTKFTHKIGEMLQELYLQEQSALEHYRQGLTLAGTKEGFRQMIESIIEQEQEHSNELIVLTEYPADVQQEEPAEIGLMEALTQHIIESTQ